MSSTTYLPCCNWIQPQSTGHHSRCHSRLIQTFFAIHKTVITISSFVYYDDYIAIFSTYVLPEKGLLPGFLDTQIWPFSTKQSDTIRAEASRGGKSHSQCVCVICLCSTWFWPFKRFIFSSLLLSALPLGHPAWEFALPS
jgi:hypothetical protein